MPTSRKKIIRKLKKLGFSGLYSGGKHQFMTKESLKLRTPNPHKAGDIKDPLLREILKRADIDFEDWHKI
jgi:predicted RNA binding protein YcfA (HicA-like mRNA interferase family)